MIMSDAKYVRIEDSLTGSAMYIFPAYVNHSGFAKRFKGKVISAGFVRKNEKGKLECYGSSESLNIGSDEKDTYIANRMIKGLFDF
jgi:hypothetical protein